MKKQNSLLWTPNRVLVLSRSLITPPVYAYPRTARVRLPTLHRYAQPTVVVPIAGVLPFGSIFIEMYFILTSLWGYMYYYVYGFMLLVFAILVVVLVCTTIVAVYFVLNAEVRAPPVPPPPTTTACLV